MALERWLLHKRVVVVSPAGPEGPRRLAAAGAARVLVLGGQCPAEAGLEVLPGPVATEALPLRDASVDAVACLEGFADLDADSRRSLIAEAGRVLRDGGILAVCTASDGAALSRAEADLRDRFAHVVSFAELAWQGVSLAPVLAHSPADALTPVLREGLLPAPLPPRRHLVLASATPLEGPQRECVIIPTGSAGPREEIAAATSTREEIAAREIAAVPLIAPTPAIAAPPDLDDLFGDAPTIAPAIAPAIAPPRPISAPDPALLAELAELRRTVADLAPLRERAAEFEHLRTQVAEVEQLREQAAEVERLRAQLAEVAELRERAAETDQAAEVERLRAQLAEVAELRERAAETEQLREQVVTELERLHERAVDADQLREQAAEIERLREQAAEAEHLREQVVEAERLRERVDEHLRHRLAEAEQLHQRAAGQLAEVEQLRERAAEAERLREQLAEVEQLRERAAEAERLREQLAAVEPLREQPTDAEPDPLELQRLRERAAEAERLREQLAELERLRAAGAEPPVQLVEQLREPGDQSAELARLREQLAELAPLREQLAELEELREDAVELVYLREQLAQLEPLRGRADEIERLRRRDAAVAEERDKLIAHAARLAGELERSREEKARTEAELHSARLRIESLQRVPEDSRLHSLAALTGRPDGPHAGPRLAAHELVDEIAPLVAPETGRATTDAALDRNRLREELARRTGELQTLETRVLQQEEELRRERLENVRLVTDVDRLREQVERSRAIELERVQELERLGHELRALEVNHAELQGMYNTQEQRLRDRGELVDDEDGGALLELGDEDGDAREKLDQVSAERDQLKARERASAELARRRDRELAEATRTVRDLRRSVDEHASVAAELRGELAVLQVHVQRLEETVPVLQERLRDQQRKTLDREEEASELQRRLEESVAEQEHLRGRLRKLRQDLDAIGSAKQGAEVELFRLRRELEAKHEAIEQLQQIVALGVSSFGDGDGELSDAARNELLRLRAAMAEQAADHAEALARSEAEHQRVVEGERGRLRRARLEAAIRAEEMEYLLYLLDTAEQKIWEMNDAEGRAAARLAAGLAQLDKQREQYEDLADELEVTRNLLVEAQAKVAELERALDNERARLARVSGPPEIQPDAPTGSFEINLHEPDPEAEDMLAPLIQRDPDESDRLAGINFDDDDDGEESMAVRLAASPVPEPTEADLASVGSAEVSGPRFALPSDDVDIDDDDDDVPLPPRVVVVPDEDEDEDDEVFSIDTEWDDDDDHAAEAITVVSRPPSRPPSRLPTPSRPPPKRELSAAEREPSNSRIVIELLEDEAWPEDDPGGDPGADPDDGGKGGGKFRPG